MALFNKLHLRLNFSNLARRIAYRAYDFYARRISSKLPVYDMEVVSIIRRLPQDAVCIDVGVNEAQLFSVMVRHCKEGHVYGFEPIPKLYRFLSGKFSGNNIHVYPYALSDTEEKTSFYYFPGRTGVSGMSNRLPLLNEFAVEKIPVQTAILDNVLDLARIDLIKIDVEGAELKVLRGAKQHIIRCRPVIVFECQQNGFNYFDTTPEDIFQFFRELGYGISLTAYFLRNQPPMDEETLKNLIKHRYEYQFVAWPC